MFSFPFIAASTPPVAFTLFHLSIYWYALMYPIAIGIGWYLAHYRIQTLQLNWTQAQLNDLVFYSTWGIALGGRIGSLLFYTHLSHLTNLKLLLYSIFNRYAGMSFYGGLLGVMIAVAYYSYMYKQSFLETLDFIAPLIPQGLGLGRLGNFINGELWGRPTLRSWGVIFPQKDWVPRHPSQLYELLLEGVLLHIIVWQFSKKPRPKGAVAGLFALFYAFFRFVVEFVREPDPVRGFVAWNWLTMGQLLSSLLFCISILLLTVAYKPIRKK